LFGRYSWIGFASLVEGRRQRAALDEFEQPYEVFANAAETGALKVFLSQT